jgi:D-cysteine desulfhydrase
VTVSRSVADQKPKVVTLQQAVAEQLELKAKADILLWDDYFAPGYGTPNEEGMEAVKLLARLEGILLIRSIPAKRWPGLLTALRRNALRMKGRFYLSIPAGRLRCLPIILMSKNQVEK